MRLARRASLAFTLIEMLAVVLLIALVASVAAPTLNFGGSRAVRQEAEDLGAAIEYARQRAVMTGRAHQLVLNLDAHAYTVEWAQPAPEEAPAPTAEESEFTQPPIDMLAPAAAAEEFVPAPGGFGRGHALPEGVWLLEVELPRELVAEGAVTLRLTPDGTAEPATIFVSDPDREQVLGIEVRPLADAVVIFDDSA